MDPFLKPRGNTTTKTSFNIARKWTLCSQNKKESTWKRTRKIAWKSITKIFNKDERALEYDTVGKWRNEVGGSRKWKNWTSKRCIKKRGHHDYRRSWSGWIPSRTSKGAVNSTIRWNRSMNSWMRLSIAIWWGHRSEQASSCGASFWSAVAIEEGNENPQWKGESKQPRVSAIAFNKSAETI